MATRYRNRLTSSRVIRGRAGRFTGGIAFLLLLAGCSPAESAPRKWSLPPHALAPRAASSNPVTAPTDKFVTADVDVAYEVADLASEAVTAFCRPFVEYDVWIAELYPFLSEVAGAAYETVDPVNVPCTTVTGAGVSRPGDDPYTVGVVVPTDAGEYLVYVHRVEADAPWAVEQITPVAAE